jgi:hypothetical protein
VRIRERMFFGHVHGGNAPEGDVEYHEWIFFALPCPHGDAVGWFVVGPPGRGWIGLHASIRLPM